MSRRSKLGEAVVLLIDVGKTVIQEEYDGQSFLFKSKQCASKIVQRKMFSDSVDQVSLILIGSNKSKNDLDYPNINVKYDHLTSPNWNVLHDIENLSGSDVDSGDWSDGLIVAMNLLKNESEVKTFSEQKIILMSNFASSLRSESQIDDVIQTLRDLNIKLVVIGSEKDDEESAKNPNTQMKEAIISRIVDEVEGAMCGFDEAMTMLDHFQKVTARAQPWNCHLEIGKSISIPITGYKKFASKKILQWKKKSIDNGAIDQETVFFQDDKQIEQSDVINSYLFGQTVIPISGDDKIAMALKTEKCCQLIGFTKRKNVPRYMYLDDSVQYIAPQRDVKAAVVAVTALVKALLDLDMVCIVRKVYCKNSAPHVGALIPTCEHDSYFFYYAPLPFAEDERFIRLPSLNKVQPRQEQLDAVDQLIDNMDLTELEEDEDFCSKLINPSIEHTNNMIVFKALNPESKLPSAIPEMLSSLMKQMPDILHNAAKSLDNIKKLFNLEEVEEKIFNKAATKVFKRNNTDNMEIKNVKSEALPDTMASVIQNTVTEIGTVDPEGNFLKLLELNEPLKKLSEQMQAAIKKLIFTSSSKNGLLKPLSALCLLRKHCVMSEPSMYNQFIASLKDDLVDRDENDCWNLIIKDKLGLITTEESKESCVSNEEADIFYQIKKTDSQNELQYEMEAEDMLDMI